MSTVLFLSWAMTFVVSIAPEQCVLFSARIFCIICHWSKNLSIVEYSLSLCTNHFQTSNAANSTLYLWINEIWAKYNQELKCCTLLEMTTMNSAMGLAAILPLGFVCFVHLVHNSMRYYQSDLITSPYRNMHSLRNSLSLTNNQRNFNELSEIRVSRNNGKVHEVCIES